MKWLWMVLFLPLIASPAWGTPPAQIAVSPDLFRVELDNPRPHALTVMNLSDRTLEATTSVTGWTLENDRVVPTPPSSSSLDQWIILNPLELRIAPGESQIIRFAIRPPVKPAAGEHRAMLWIQEKFDNQKTASLKARFRLGVAIYADNAPVEREGEFVNAKFDPDTNRLALLFTNKGNAHDRPFGEVRLAGGPLEEPLNLTLPQRPVLPGETATQYLPLPPLKPGDYELIMQGHFYDKTQQFDHNMEIRIP